MLLEQYLFNTLLSVLLDVYPDVLLLDHMVILLLSFCGTTILFSTAAAPFYYVSHGTQGFQFLHIFTNTYFLFCFCFFNDITIQWV